MSNEIRKIFKETGALLEGHFELSSGLHSNRYFQCAKLLQFPKYTRLVASKLIDKLGKVECTTVVSPALGGIVIGYEVARQLDKKRIFAERKKGDLVFRRGFTLDEGEEVLVVEDVVTTGGSVKELIELVKGEGAVVKDIGVLVDRSEGVEFASDYTALIEVDVEQWEPDSCALCEDGEPIDKPGSKKFDM